MIESNIRKLSRMELLYTCISKLAIHVNKANASALPDDLKHYLDPNDFNRVIYHQRSTDADDRIKQLLADADRLLALCESDYNDVGVKTINKFNPIPYSTLKNSYFVVYRRGLGNI